MKWRAQARKKQAKDWRMIGRPAREGRKIRVKLLF